MAPITPPQNPNPAANVYQIGGVPVEFPYKPYGSQLAFMGRVISTLERARRQGHCHALLESPTGTGKSLSLLCSSLAWQHHIRHRRHLDPRPTPDPSPSPIPDPLQPTPDPLVHGGGFIPEPSRNLEQTPKATSTSIKANKKPAVPKIYYASRTHSQITQVIREFRKTSYRVPMAVLASRKQYCTNKYVCAKDKVDEECKSLLKDTGAGCPEFKNSHKVKGHSSLQKGGCYEVHDIEDLRKVGQTVKGCSYFAAQALAEDAELVFCPYSYIINPVVRRAMDLDIKGSIIILDEAHNIEDMARESGSLDVEEEVLYTLQTELGQLCTVESVAMIYQPLYDMIQGIISWMADRRNNLQKHDFEHYSSYWTGDRAMRELQQAGITQQCFPILQECATKAIKASSDADPESDEVFLSGISSITLEELVSSLGYLFSGNGCHAVDYQVALQRYVKRDGSNTASGWTNSLSLWCLNPAVVFKEIADLSLSVILTSGTLSPMSSFASELGVQFDACMEAPHVIDVDSQLWAAVISSGPRNFNLNASYKTADGYDFQDELGVSLEEICKVVPGGALVFFPSYKLMEKLRVRWLQTGQWSRLNAQKPIFVEPRGNMDDFELVLKGYYDSILGKNKVAYSKRRRGLKRGVKLSSADESLQNPSKSGAVFLAVCRGKVSEGIDFSDENARAVVVVGIPFPNTNDIQIVLKKRYNDTYKSSKGLLSGSEWYCQQAFRALNQAAGRCIRHRFDYGAIIFLDERYKEERNVAHISKWLRNSIKQYGSFEESLEGLQAFFLDAQERLTQKGEHTQKTELFVSDISKISIPSLQKNIMSQQISEKRTESQNKLIFPNRRKVVPDNNTQHKNQSANFLSPLPVVDVSGSEVKAGGNMNSKTLHRTNKRLANRLTETSDVEPVNTLDQYLVIKETLEVDDSYPVVPETCDEYSDRTYFSPPTLSKDERFEHAYTSIGSPERVVSTINASEQLMVINRTIDSGDLVQSCSPFTFLPSEISKDGSPGPLQSLVSTLAESMIVKTTIGDQSLDSKSVQTCNQSSERPFSFPTTVSEGKVVKSSFTSIGSPETFVAVGFSNVVPESSLSTNVNSNNQRKRKLLASQPCCSNQTDCFRSLESESFREVDCSVATCVSSDADRRTDSPYRLGFKLKENSVSSSSDLTEKKLHLCCSICKNPLGLDKNKFLVTCSLTSLSKVYMSYVSRHGPTSTFSPEDLVGTTLHTHMSVVVSDISFVHPSIQNASQNGFWSEVDGCVFRAVVCPFCTESKACLGVQVLATDSPNTQLLNKILFYADRLDIKGELSSKCEATESVGASIVSHRSSLIDLDYYIYKPRPGNLSKMKSKVGIGGFFFVHFYLFLLIITPRKLVQDEIKGRNWWFFFGSLLFIFTYNHFNSQLKLPKK